MYTNGILYIKAKLSCTGVKKYRWCETGLVFIFLMFILLVPSLVLYRDHSTDLMHKRRATRDPFRPNPIGRPAHIGFGQIVQNQLQRP